MSSLLRSSLDRLLKLVEHNNSYQCPPNKNSSVIGLRIAVALFTLLMALWFVSATFGWLNTHFIPSPQQLVQALIHLFQPDEWYQFGYFRNYSFIEHYVISFVYRLGIAYLTGLFLGVLVGVIAGTSETRGPSFNLLIAIPFNNVPKMVLLMLFVVWFGIGNFSTILIVGLSTFLTVSVITYGKIAHDSDQGLIEAAAALNLRPRQIARFITLPLAIPTMFFGFRLGLYRAIGILFFAEYSIGNSGLGALLGWAGERGDAAFIFAVVAIIFATIGLFTTVLRVIELSFTKHLKY